MDNSIYKNTEINYPKGNKKSIPKRTLKEINSGKNQVSPINKKKESQLKKKIKIILLNIALQIYMII